MLPELTSWNKDDPNVTHEMVQDKLSDSFESERTQTQIPSKRSAVGQGIICTVVRIVGMGRMSHICNTKCSRL